MIHKKLNLMIILLLLFGFNIWGFKLNSHSTRKIVSSDEIKQCVYSVQNYTPRGPILINENAKIKFKRQLFGAKKQIIQSNPIIIQKDEDFNEFSLTGNGTANNPYIINNLNITSNIGQSLINIENTQAYFMLAGNFLNGIDEGIDGIRLVNVSHGVLFNNFFTNTYHALDFESGTNKILIYNNTFEKNYLGLQLTKSFENTIIENVFKTSNYGISDQGQSNNLNWKNIFVTNIITNIRYHTITLQYSEDNIYLGNNISNSDWGIFLNYAANKNTFIGNTVSNMTYRGIDTASVNNKDNIIKNNNFYNNNEGQNQASDSYNNNNTYKYNFFNDHISPDNDNDGIVDVAYSVDNYPRTAPHTLTKPTLITPKTNNISIGLIEIEWKQSIDSLGHKLKYDIYYSNNGGSTWTMIGSEVNTTTILWDNTQQKTGKNYWIKIKAAENTEFYTEFVYGPFTINEKIIVTTTSTTTTPATTSTTTTTTITPSWNALLLLLSLFVMLSWRQRKKKS